jgi:pyroglutamyl-peptidase
MKPILVTGFEPFGGEPINSALEVAMALNGRRIKGYEIVSHALPVVRQVSIDTLVAHIRNLDPEIIVALGQAGGQTAIAPERIAINMDDYTMADNAGSQPIDEQIHVNGPAAYWSTLPIKTMTRSMIDAGIPASVSNSAGTYLCNHLFYGLMHHLAQEGDRRRGGFVHIPYLPEQAARLGKHASMSRETMVHGLTVAIEASIQ